MWDTLALDDDIPTNIDHGTFARWAEANGIDPLDAAKILARIVDVRGNVGMDVVKGLLGVIHSRQAGPPKRHGLYSIELAGEVVKHAIVDNDGIWHDAGERVSPADIVSHVRLPDLVGGNS